MSVDPPTSETPTPELADELPQVALPRRNWAMPLAVLFAAALGVLVFAQMNAHRLAMESGAPLGSARPTPFSVASVPNAPPPETQIHHELAQGMQPGLNLGGVPPASAPAPGAALTSAPDPASARLASPALVVDLSTPAPAQGQGGAATLDAHSVGDMLSSNERYAQRLGANVAAHAEPGHDPRVIVPEGALIAAVLETAVNSDLPGSARALVSRDVKSFDGSHLLIPRGSRLIGQYRSAVSLGQSRAFVIWTRLVRPDGVSMDLAEPGADALGRAGLEGRVDTHFLRRFGGAILLSLISAGADAAQSDNDTRIVIAGAQGVGAGASEITRDLDVQPTVDVAQGTPIRVFVTRDLDFSGAPVL